MLVEARKLHLNLAAGKLALAREYLDDDLADVPDAELRLFWLRNRLLHAVGLLADAVNHLSTAAEKR